MYRSEYTMGIIGRAEVQEGHVARGAAECYMSFKNFREANNLYERIRYINWFVVWIKQTKQKLVAIELASH